MDRRHAIPAGVSVLIVAIATALAVPGAHARAGRNWAAGPGQAISADELVREIIRNEIQAQLNDTTHWRYRELEDVGGREELREVIETDQGTIARLLAISGHPLTPEQRRKEDARIAKILSNPEMARKLQLERHADGQKERRLLELFPDAFLFRYAGTEGDLIHFTYRPNPRFHATNREAQVFHHMAGDSWVDARQKRLVELDGHLISEVKFFGGLLGHLNEGGTFYVRQEDVGSGRWELSTLSVKMQGRALFFKTINVQQEEKFWNYEPLPPDITLEQAATLLDKDANAALDAVTAQTRKN